MEELESADPADESLLWSIVEGYVEPVAVLRATVQDWATRPPHSECKHQAAENVLLLLDVDLLADSRQASSRVKHGMSEAPPVWAMPRPAPLVLAGAPSVSFLAEPPSLHLDPARPVSMRIKDAAAHASWLEAACLACARLITTARNSPCRLECPNIGPALGPAADIC